MNSFDLPISRSYSKEFSTAYQEFFRHLSGKHLAKTITFVVTEDCTLRCSYCYEKHKNSNNKMSLETGKKCIDILFEEDLKGSPLFGEENASALILDFIGGEPLLEIKLIDQIIEYFLEKAVSLNHRWKTEYMISMISNGTQYFTKEVQDFIKKYNGRLSMSITIDGNQMLHDSCRKFPDGSPSFHLAQKAYLDVLDKGLTDSTKMTISPDNLPYLEDALKELASYEKVRNIPANPIFEHEWSCKEASLYYDQLKSFAKWMIENKIYERLSCSIFSIDFLGASFIKDQNYCGGTGKMLAFSPEGEIYPCLRYLPFSLQNKNEREKLLLGHSERGLLKTEEEKKTFSFLESITCSSQSSEKCLTCPISSGCGWCSGWNFDKYGTPNKRDESLCNMHKARVLVNVFYWNSLCRSMKLDLRFPMNVPKDWALEIISEDEYNMLVELAKEDY